MVSTSINFFVSLPPSSPPPSSNEPPLLLFGDPGGDGYDVNFEKLPRPTGSSGCALGDNGGNFGEVPLLI